MKSSFKSILPVLILGAISVFGPPVVSGQAPGMLPTAPAWLDEVPCTKNNQPSVGQAFDGGSAVLCLEYDAKQLRADPNQERREVPLTITGYTAKNVGPLEILQVSLRSSSQRGLEFQSQGPGTPAPCPPNCSCRTFKYLVNIITREVRSDDYHTKVNLQLGKEIQYPEFDLPIAAPGDWLELESHSGSAISCWTGSDCSNLRLKLINKLPWEVNILGIEANNQEGLVEDLAKFNQQEQRTIPVDNVPHNIDVKVSAKSLSWSGVFAGFGKAPRADLLVRYQARGHTFEKTVPVNLQIKPNFLILVITVLLGVFFGTIIRIDLRRLEKSGLINRRQLIAFACTTISTGIFVSLVALLANIKLVAFEEERIYSSWDPRVLFLTGLIGTIGGIPLIYGLLKLPKVETPKPPESSPPEKAE